MDSQDSKFFDSHIHLNSNRISGGEDKKEDGIFNNVSTNLEDFYIALEQAKEHENVYVTAGIHPLELDDLDMVEVISELDMKIRDNPKVIAIGETGLDFYRGNKDLEEDKQKRGFYAQFELARKHNLPLVLHIRKAHEEVLDLLEGVIDGYGVIHCFEGTEDVLKRYLNLPGNGMISVSPLIFRDTSCFRDLIHKVNIDRLLVETDSPYLASNHEKIFEIISFIAQEKELQFEECKKLLWDNFCRFFTKVKTTSGSENQSIPEN